MNTISDSAIPWNTNVEVAVVTNGAPDRTGGGKDDTEEGEDGFKMFGDDGFTFLDFLDIINPLQHIPILNSFYREWSGDTLDPGSRVLGSTLFFGPVGTVASIANVLVEDATGKDVGEHFMAFFEDDNQELTDSDTPSGNPKSSPVVIADVGARSFAPPVAPSPAQEQADKNPASPAQMAMADSSGPLDPVTAWAMSETVYRNSAVGKSTPLPESSILDGYPGAKPSDLPVDWKAVPNPERAALPMISEAANTIRDARAATALYAATTYGRAKPETGQEGPRTTRDKPSGAIAAEGGWFTDTMLTALDRYKDGADLAAREKPAVVDLNR